VINPKQNVLVRKSLNDKTDEQKRNIVFTAGQAGRILVKLTTRQDLGLPRTQRDDTAIETKHAAQAERQGVDFNAYRTSRGDTGKKVVENAQNVRLDTFAAELAKLGYEYVGGHAYDKDDRVVSVLAFQLNVKPEDAQDVPENIWKILNEITFQFVHVWANQTADGRLDTINCVGTSQSKRYNRLVFEGKANGTYAVVPAEQLEVAR
jgi:hypothetical protein